MSFIGEFIKAGMTTDGVNVGLVTGQEMQGSRFVVHSGPMAATDLDKEIFIAPAACKLISVYEIHSVVCDAADTIQIEKLTVGEDSDAGDDLLTTAFTLNTTKDTAVVQTIAAANLAKASMVAGDRLAPIFASGDGTNWVGSISLLIEWL